MDRPRTEEPLAAEDGFPPFSCSEPIYVLRTTQQNQVQLNLMADQKANIIIGVSLIFFTIAQRQLVQGIGENPILILPLLILALTMLGAFVLALIVVTPRMRPLRRCTPEKLPNPLFFGFFPGVPENDYTEFMMDRTLDVKKVREMFIRDIHQTGTVLRRKYRCLRISYLFLATGVLTAGVATLWVFLAEQAG